MAKAGYTAEADAAEAVIRVLDPNGNVVAEYPGIALEMATEIGGTSEEDNADGGN